MEATAAAGSEAAERAAAETAAAETVAVATAAAERAAAQMVAATAAAAAEAARAGVRVVLGWAEAATAGEQETVVERVRDRAARVGLGVARAAAREAQCCS